MLFCNLEDYLDCYCNRVSSALISYRSSHSPNNEEYVSTLPTTNNTMHLSTTLRSADATSGALRHRAFVPPTNFNRLDVVPFKMG